MNSELNNNPCSPKRRAFESLFAPKSGLPGPDGWFHLRSVHLIAGSSGAGKTTWLLKEIRKWRDAEAVLNRRSCFNGDYLFVVLDRDEEDIERTAADLGLDVSDLHVYMVPDAETDKSLGKVILPKLLTAIRHKEMKIGGKYLENVRAVIVEGLDMGMTDGDPSDSDAVKKYLRALRKTARDFNVAIIGTVGSPKMKPRDKYEAARDRINGSHFWSRLSGTVVLIEVDSVNDDIRWMHFIPRHGKPEKFRYEWKNGRLEYAPVGSNAAPQNTADRRIMAWATPRGAETFTPKQVCLDLNLDDSTVNSALQRLVKSEELVRAKQGVYQLGPKSQRSAGADAVTDSPPSDAAGSSVTDQPNLTAGAEKTGEAGDL